MKGFGLAAPGVASRSTLPGPSQKGHEELAHSGSRTTFTAPTGWVSRGSSATPSTRRGSAIG